MVKTTSKKNIIVFIIATCALLCALFSFTSVAKAEIVDDEAAYEEAIEWTSWEYEDSGIWENFSHRYNYTGSLSGMDHIWDYDTNAIHISTAGEGSNVYLVTLELTSSGGWLDVQVIEDCPLIVFDIEFSAQADENYYFGEDMAAPYYIFVKDLTLDTVRIDRSLFSQDVCIEGFSYYAPIPNSQTQTFLDLDTTNVRYNDEVISIHEFKREAGSYNTGEEAQSSTPRFEDVSSFFDGDNSGEAGGESGGTEGGGESGGTEGGGDPEDPEEPEDPEDPNGELIEIEFFDESIIDSIGEKAYATITVGVDALTLPVAPTKDYYTFVSWYYLNEELEECYINSTNFLSFANSLTKSSRLYTKWRENVLITFNYFDGNAEVNEVYDLTANAGSPFPFEPERPGYDFVGWYYFNETNEFVEFKEEQIYSLSESLTLYAQWTKENGDMPISSSSTSQENQETSSSTEDETLSISTSYAPSKNNKKWGLGLSNNVTNIVWLVIIVVILIVVFKNKKNKK